MDNQPDVLQIAKQCFNELWEAADQCTERSLPKDRAWTFFLLGVAEGARQSVKTVKDVLGRTK